MSNKKPVPGYIWMLAGLAIGLFAAFLVYLGKQPAEDISFTQAVKQELKKARQQQATEQQQPATQREAREPPADSKPRFEFYTILSELEVFVPEPEAEQPESNRASASSTTTSSQSTAPASGKQYLLQAGSFRSRPDAESLKASLALLGVQSSIQSVKINSDTWHRVRIGPFSNPTRLRDTLSTLKQNNIHAMTMELK